MIVNGLKFNCLARLTLMQSMEQTGESSWNEIEQAMIGNTSVTDVYLGPYFYSSYSPTELAAFLHRCATTLTNLRVLSIGTLEYTKTTIDAASALSQSQFLSTAKHLCTLRIERNLLLQSRRDVTRLANGFRNHPSLKRVSLPNLHPAFLWMDESEQPEAPQDHDPGDDNDTLMRMDGSQHSQSLMEGTLDPLLEAMASLVNLESLQLGLSYESFDYLQSMDQMDRVSSPQALSQLGTLSHLSWLVISRFHVQDAHVEALCQCLGQTHAPVKILDLTKTRRVTARAWKAMLTLLQTHVHLEALDMMLCPTDPEAMWYKKQVHLFLKLNREGRRRKLRELPADQHAWISTVARYFSNDLTALTILVRESPWICLPPQPQQQQQSCASRSFQSSSSSSAAPQEPARHC